MTRPSGTCTTLLLAAALLGCGSETQAPAVAEAAAAEAPSTSAEVAAPTPGASSTEGAPALAGSALDPRTAKQEALKDAMDFGMSGIKSRTEPWGHEDNAGSDAKPRGNMSGEPIGDGHGPGTKAGKPPAARVGVATVSAGLPPEVVQRIVRQNAGRFRLCYETALRANLAGQVEVSFTINKKGNVASVKGGGDLPDKGVIACVSKAFHGLSFPEPEGSVAVTGKIGIGFIPGDGVHGGGQAR